MENPGNMENINQDQELLLLLKPVFADSDIEAVFSHEDLVHIRELRFSLTSERVETLVREHYRELPEEKLDELIAFLFEDV